MNYPDNIRDFDNHPGSPFYVEPLTECGGCDDFIDEDANHNLVTDEQGRELTVCDYCLSESEEYTEVD